MRNFIKALCIRMYKTFTSLKPTLKFMLTSFIPPIIVGIAIKLLTSNSELAIAIAILVWFTAVTFMCICAHAENAIEYAKKNDDISFEEAWFITSIYDDDDNF